jgi:hypothetical protein
VSRSTGPVLATGLVTVVNQTVFHNEPMDWRVPIATGLAAIGFGLAERAAPDLVVVLAWTAFLTVMLTRTNPKVPSPVESAVDWWKKG